ncbi:hypothetical protein D3C73_1269200 [compost metagenome]
MSGKHRRKGGSHYADEKVEQHSQHQQTGKDQADLAAVDEHEGRDGEEEQADATEDNEGAAANLVADEPNYRLDE